MAGLTGLACSSSILVLIINPSNFKVNYKKEMQEPYSIDKIKTNKKKGIYSGLDLGLGSGWRANKQVVLERESERESEVEAISGNCDIGVNGKRK